ncbi:hypothetical protein GCM10027610_140890 [Dactylosporangium cerinum]
MIELMPGAAETAESHPADAEPGQGDPAEATPRAAASSGPAGREDTVAAAATIPGPAAPEVPAVASNGSDGDSEKVQTDRAARQADGTT